MVADVKVMEIKKEKQRQSLDLAVSKQKKTSFIEEMKSEFKAITWTSKQELITYTQIVVGATFALGLGVYFVDLTIQNVLEAIATVARWIGG